MIRQLIVTLFMAVAFAEINGHRKPGKPGHRNQRKPVQSSSSSSAEVVRKPARRCHRRSSTSSSSSSSSSSSREIPCCKPCESSTSVEPPKPVEPICIQNVCPGIELGEVRRKPEQICIDPSLCCIVPCEESSDTCESSTSSDSSESTDSSSSSSSSNSSSSSDDHRRQPRHQHGRCNQCQRRRRYY